MMEHLEAMLARGVSEGKIPYAVVVASSRDGSFNYTHTTGTVSSDHNEPVQEDALFQLASCTKLLTAIAVLQVVEKRLFGMDDDVAGILPELAEQQILQGFDEQDKPILVERKNAITLRTLLTHSSGVAYEGISPELMKYHAQKGTKIASHPTILGRYSHPLVFEPGTAWLYGAGLDWAGLLLERVTSVSLDVWVQTHMLTPLFIPSGEIIFSRDAPDFASRVPRAFARDANGILMPSSPGPLFFNKGTTDAFGGHSAYSTMRAYHTVLRDLLCASPDHPSALLTLSSVETLFIPSLSPASKSALNILSTQPIFQYFVGRFPTGVEFDFAPGGIVQCADATGYGRRKQGQMSWGGVPNTFWSIDRAAGLAIAFGTQVLPLGDERVKEMITAVEEAVYREVGVVV